MFTTKLNLSNKLYLIFVLACLHPKFSFASNGMVPKNIITTYRVMEMTSKCWHFSPAGPDPPGLHRYVRWSSPEGKLVKEIELKKDTQVIPLSEFDKGVRKGKTREEGKVPYDRMNVAYYQKWEEVLISKNKKTCLIRFNELARCEGRVDNDGVDVFYRRTKIVYFDSFGKKIWEYENPGVENGLLSDDGKAISIPIWERKNQHLWWHVLFLDSSGKPVWEVSDENYEILPTGFFSNNNRYYVAEASRPDDRDTQYVVKIDITEKTFEFVKIGAIGASIGNIKCLDDGTLVGDYSSAGMPENPVVKRNPTPIIPTSEMDL